MTARNGLLGKDTVNGATISSHTAPAHGTLTLLGSGAFTYVPRPSFSGTDHFTYTLRNSLGRSTATVSIAVSDPVRGPVRSVAKTATPAGLKPSVPGDCELCATTGTRPTAGQKCLGRLSVALLDHL